MTRVPRWLATPVATVFILGAVGVAAMGCREQTAGERAGAAIDEALSGAKDKIEEAEDSREEVGRER
jgi:hypothetical protein